MKEYEQQRKDRSHTSLALRSVRQAERDAASSQQANEASKPLPLEPQVLQKKILPCMPFAVSLNRQSVLSVTLQRTSQHTLGHDFRFKLLSVLGVRSCRACANSGGRNQVNNAKCRRRSAIKNRSNEANAFSRLPQ